MISKELSKMMGKESEHTAVFGSIMRWEWAKRLPEKEAKKFLSNTQCPLCIRHGIVADKTHICGVEKCTFYEICPCPTDDSLYEKATRALRAGNEKDWKKYSAQLCNALWACWNKLFEKPERTYKAGDRFQRGKETLRLICFANRAILISENDNTACLNPINVDNTMKITKVELDKMHIASLGEITLIE